MCLTWALTHISYCSHPYDPQHNYNPYNNNPSISSYVLYQVLSLIDLMHKTSSSMISSSPLKTAQKMHQSTSSKSTTGIYTKPQQLLQTTPIMTSPIAVLHYLTLQIMMKPWMKKSVSHLLMALLSPSSVLMNLVQHMAVQFALLMKPFAQHQWLAHLTTRSTLANTPSQMAQSWTFKV